MKIISRFTVNVLALACLCLMFTTAARAGEGIAQLHDFYGKVKSMQARFTQQILDPNGKLQQEAAGQMYIQRPGQFRWDYQQPYEQLILADGRRLWIYDADLEQVTVKKMDETLGQTPAMLLSGTRPLEEQFSLTDLGVSNGVAWVELLPLARDSSFVRMRLGFSGRELSAMEMWDGLGQITRLRFSQVQRNPVLDAKLFVFVTPPGADVIGEVE